MNYEPPKEPGIYWAKSFGYKWLNLIVSVSGDAPFLIITVYDMGEDRILKKAPSNFIEEWGPEIKRPQ